VNSYQLSVVNVVGASRSLISPHPLVPPSPQFPIRTVQEKVREKLGLCKDTVIILATNTDSSYIEKIAESQYRNVNNIVHYNESFFSESIEFSFRPFNEY